MQTPNQTSNQGSVLALLRSVAPQRRLTMDETLTIAELQANRLLEYFSIESTAVPTEIVSDLPRIKVEFEYDIPASGAAHWNGSYWVITINADESPLRQRFSLMHEFKHIIDHTHKQYLYHDEVGSTAHDQAERVANYFAACVLMPKRVIKREWCRGGRSLIEVARELRVSAPALRYRLQYVGLLDRAPRCEPSSTIRAPRRVAPRHSKGHQSELRPMEAIR